MLPKNCISSCNIMASQLTKTLNQILHWLEQNSSDDPKDLQPGLSKGEIDKSITR